MATSSLYATSTLATDDDCKYCSDLIKSVLIMKAKCLKCKPGNFKTCQHCDPMWMSFKFLNSNHDCTKKANKMANKFLSVAPTGSDYDCIKPPKAHMEEVVKLLQETFPEKTKDVIIAIWEQCNWNEAKAFEALFALNKHNVQGKIGTEIGTIPAAETSDSDPDILKGTPPTSPGPPARKLYEFQETNAKSKENPVTEIMTLFEQTSPTPPPYSPLTPTRLEGGKRVRHEGKKADSGPQNDVSSLTPPPEPEKNPKV